MGVLFLVPCKCGQLMQQVTPKSEYRLCPNCDMPQPQEYVGGKRKRTKADTQFNVRWLQVARYFYPSNFDRNGRDRTAGFTDGLAA